MIKSILDFIGNNILIISIALGTTIYMAHVYL